MMNTRSSHFPYSFVSNKNQDLLIVVSFFPACTFLGPSRKRGPPKGYIDAIEARLHQTEALIGIMIGSNDERAQGLLEDLKKVISRYARGTTSTDPMCVFLTYCI